MLTTLLLFVGFRKPAPLTFARESAPEPARPSRWQLQRAPRGAVLMLDIDGVLHPGQSGSLIYLPMLETWLREQPGVDVVISSNWRETHTLDELRGFFSDDLRPRVIGCTPILPDARREDEILFAVREYGIAKWAAIDDRTQEFPATAATNLVATDYLDGITAHSLARLTTLLGTSA